MEAVNYKKILIYADGSVGPSNPGEGGWASILIAENKSNNITIAKYGYAESPVTNNQMELMAIENGLKLINPKWKTEIQDFDNIEIDLFTDSQWAMNSCNGTFKNLKKNLDIIKNIKDYINNNDLNIAWNWVRGHNDDIYNEACDKIATHARTNKESKIIIGKENYDFFLNTI